MVRQAQRAASGRWLADEPVGHGWRRVRVVLVRHGESVWNAAGVIQGHQGPGLTALGVAQARAVALAVQEGFPDACLVVRSDIERVAETAAPLAGATGLPVTVDPRLREIDNGVWSGRTTAAVAEEYPDDLAAIRRGEDIPRGGGETFGQLRDRVARALRDIALAGFQRCAPDARQTSVVVFTHGGPIRVAVAEALGLPPGGHRLIDPPANCSVTVLDQIVDAGTGLRSTSLVAYNRAESVPVSEHADDVAATAGTGG